MLNLLLIIRDLDQFGIRIQSLFENLLGVNLGIVAVNEIYIPLNELVRDHHRALLVYQGKLSSRLILLINCL
jgi:hypothetical protein